MLLLLLELLLFKFRTSCCCRTSPFIITYQQLVQNSRTYSTVVLVILEYLVQKLRTTRTTWYSIAAGVTYSTRYLLLQQQACHRSCHHSHATINQAGWRQKAKLRNWMNTKRVNNNQCRLDDICY